ncbi:MAG: acyl-CoA dehydratase activase-related protein [candidate division WOR-3 bacterium]|nr:acyl-CoA dehydratase activase-related protein [candidate division WOR-3 bacterium]
MKATFPNFGYETLALKTFLEKLGASVVLPPANTKHTLEMGVKYSSELICLPFKITLGNFIEALNRGADTLFMAAGAKKCRFGYYHYLHEMILRKLFPRFRLYAISQYTPYQFVFEKMPQIFMVSPTRVIYALLILLAKCALIDDFKCQLRLARVLDFNQANQIEKRAIKLIESANSISQIRRTRQEIRTIFSINGKKPEIKIGLVGEIFFMIEPFANQEIEKELSRLGALVVTKRSLFRHLKHLLKIDWEFYRFSLLAYKYLKDSPGGEAIRTVGEAVSFAMSGIDGIVHIYPFTCMPENIALEALEKASEDYDVPVLSMSFDEHTSRTGFLTRLEAFVDLIKRRKRERGR